MPGLFELDGKTFAEAYNNLRSVARAIEMDARGMAYWCDSTGGGNFTPLVALTLREYLKAVIRGTHADSGYLKSTHGKYNTRYLQFKKSTGFGDESWHRTGKTAEAFKHRVVRSGNKSVGTVYIDPSATTPVISISGKQYGEIKVETVVEYLEFGHLNRPLIGKAIVKFVARHFPDMKAAAIKSLRNWVRENNSFKKVSGGPTSLKGVASSRPESDPVFKKETLNNVLNGVDKQYEAKLDKVNKDIFKNLQNLQISLAEIKKMLKG